MKIHKELYVGERLYPKGADVPWQKIYPLFLVHMGLMGSISVVLAYIAPEASLGYFLFTLFFSLAGAAFYLYFYLSVFGADEVKWMFVNAALAVYGLWLDLALVLNFFGRDIHQYQPYMHTIPILYWIMYSFLFRQCLLDLFDARNNARKERLISYGYVAVSVLLYGLDQAAA